MVKNFPCDCSQDHVESSIQIHLAFKIPQADQLQGHRLLHFVLTPLSSKSLRPCYLPNVICIYSQLFQTLSLKSKTYRKTRQQ